MSVFIPATCRSARARSWRGLRAIRHTVAATLMLASTAAFGQTVIFKETFTPSAATPIMRVSEYTRLFGGVTITYRADPPWLRGCNGWVTQFKQPGYAPAPIADCGGVTVYWNDLQQMAQALGQVDGLSRSEAQDNFAISAFTYGDPGAGYVELESSQIPFSAPKAGTGRFVTFQVDVAATSCYANAPLLQFYLVTPANEEMAVGGQINACASGREYPVDAVGDMPVTTVLAGRYIAPGAVLYAGANSLAVRMRNEQASGWGNDHAFDNIQIIDVTPTLSKRFAASPVLVGQASRLIFTIANTSDLLQKQGWAFTDTLPANMTVASPNNLATTCTGSTIEATPGEGGILITGGNLPANAASCTVSVDVVASRPGTYINDQTNLSGVIALDLDASASMDAVTNRLLLRKLSHNGTGSFAISGNNGIVDHALTITAMGVPAAGPQQVLGGSSATVDTTVNEALTADWQLRDVVCTGLEAGVSPAFTQAGTVTIPAAGMPARVGGRDIACTLENVQATDLAIHKQNESPTGGTVVRGQATTYTLRVGNNGPGTSVGAMVRDQPGAGLNCPAENAVACTGPAGACPGRAATVADLLGSPGLELGTLAPGAELSLSFQCTVE